MLDGVGWVDGESGLIESIRACASSRPALLNYTVSPTFHLHVLNFVATDFNLLNKIPKMTVRSVPQLLVWALAGLAAAQITSSATQWPIRRDEASLDAWLAAESPYALEGVLNNIGADGGKVQRASPGIVVASPSKNDPNCEYSRVRYWIF